VHVLAARSDALRSCLVIRFVRNDQRDVLFHRLTLPERGQPRRGCVALSRDDTRGAGGMEIHQVRYFLALCEEQNFTRAASRCGVAQPSLSRAIKLLEKELGGLLFDRDRVNTRLSDLGILVRPELVQIDRSATEAKRKAGKFPAARSVKSSQPRAMEAFMRAHHVIAVVAVLVIGLGAKQFLFPPKQADADIIVVPSASMNVLQMYSDIDMKTLPQQKMNDKTFVFADGD
jgi:predicted transcriptional regulator